MNNISITGLKKRSDYLKTSSARLKSVTPGLILQGRNHTPNEIRSSDLSDLRIGFTVSKKVGNAVSRNRVKRRLKAAAQNIMLAKSPKYLDLVVIGRQTALKRAFSSLLSDMEKALTQIQISKRN